MRPRKVEYTKFQSQSYTLFDFCTVLEVQFEKIAGKNQQKTGLHKIQRVSHYREHLACCELQ